VNCMRPAMKPFVHPTVTYLQQDCLFKRLNQVRPIYDTPTGNAPTPEIPAGQGFIVGVWDDHGGCHEKRYRRAA
jgi:hypothetical protein